VLGKILIAIVCLTFIARGTLADDMASRQAAILAQSQQSYPAGGKQAKRRTKTVDVVKIELAKPVADAKQKSGSAGARFIQSLKVGKKVTIVTMGTSLTGGGWRWPDVMMNDWLNKAFPRQVVFFNEGVGASSTINGPGDNKALSGLAKVKAAIAHKPDVVFIEFGTNDAYEHGAYKQSVADSKKNLTTIIDALLAANPKTEIVLQTMSPVWQAPGQMALERPHLADYFQVYRELARERGVLLVDNYAAWERLQRTKPETFKQLIPDGVHPHLEGYRQVVLPELKRSLLGK
jgi:acyl-CoA thioesterase I